jgi:hypothetical protein
MEMHRSLLSNADFDTSQIKSSVSMQHDSKQGNESDSADVLSLNQLKCSQNEYLYVGS